MTEVIWVNANSRRAYKKLPASAVCYSFMPHTGSWGRRVWAIPAADFCPSILGGGYHGKITRARVKDGDVMRCWK